MPCRQQSNGPSSVCLSNEWSKASSKSFDGQRRIAPTNLLNTKLKTVSSRSVDSATCASVAVGCSNDDSNLLRKSSGYQKQNNVRAQRRETGPIVGKNKMAYYENIEIDYLNQLTQEGYQKETVMKALSIARNDIELAREILREFASRTSRAKWLLCKFSICHVIASCLPKIVACRIISQSEKKYNEQLTVWNFLRFIFIPAQTWLLLLHISSFSQMIHLYYFSARIFHITEAVAVPFYQFFERL